MHYRESSPPRDLAPFILAYWEFAIAAHARGPFVHYVFPDGCTLLSYRASKSETGCRLRVTGPTLRSLRVSASPGDTYWGVRLQPAACRTVLGRSPAALRDASVPCEDVNAELCRALLRQLSAIGNFREATAAYSRCLRALRLNLHDLDEKAAAAARKITHCGEGVRLGEVAAAVGLSTRQLQRRFFAAVGLTPKQFARARRIRAIAVKLAETEFVNWAALAAEAGFADQSHMSHELSALTGRSPGSFERSVHKIEHGGLLK